MALLALKAAVAGVVQRALAVIETIENYNSLTLRTSVALTAGQVVRIGANGTWVLAQSDTAPHGTGCYIATRTAGANESVTAIRKGVIDGFDVSAMAFGAPVFLSDTLGSMADAAGTVSITLGRVIAVTGNVIGDAPNKLIEVDCPL